MHSGNHFHLYKYLQWKEKGVAKVHSRCHSSVGYRGSVKFGWERDSLVVVYPIVLITVVDSGLCKCCPWAPVRALMKWFFITLFKTGATFMEDDTLGDKHGGISKCE